MNHLYPRLGFDHDSGWSQLGASRQVQSSSRSVDFGQISDAAVDQMFGFEELEEVYLNAEIDDLLSDDDSDSFGDDEDTEDLDDMDDGFGASVQPYVEPQVRRPRRQEPSVPKYGSSCTSCSGASSSFGASPSHRHDVAPPRDRFGEDAYGLMLPLPFIEPPSRTDTFVDSAVVGAGLGVGFFGALWLVGALARGASS